MKTNPFPVSIRIIRPSPDVRSTFLDANLVNKQKRRPNEGYLWVSRQTFLFVRGRERPGALPFGPFACLSTT